MLNKIIYYYIKIKLLSPMSIGNGIEELTNHDFIKNKDGIPYIPATSLAGVFSHYLTVEERNIFAPVKDGDNLISPFFISDANIISNYKTSIRDGIKVNENKVTEDGAKYDFEILETGTELDFRIELTIRNNEFDSKKIIDIILNGLNNGDILIGYKTKRGYGKVKVETVKYKEFDKDNVKELLNFDKYDISKYEEYEIKNVSRENKYDTMKVELKQLGGISIRKYSSKTGNVDYEHIKSNGTSIIPGTSWSGLFRSQISKYIKDLDIKINIDDWFGSDAKKASDVIFEESTINDGIDIDISRVKIDRFSGGAFSRALFSENVHFNGNTSLNIKIKRENNEIFLGLIALVIKDISNGFLALGGETSIGRGIFEVTSCKLNNQDINLDEYIGKIR